MKRGKVLVTRPKADAQEIAGLIQSKGYDVQCVPFLNVILHKKILFDLKEYSALAFTSRNGVRAFCYNSDFRDIEVWTVGAATQDEALQQGFKNVHCAGGDVDSLKKMLGEQQKGNILYVRGEHISQNLKNDYIEDVILYNTEIVDKIDSNTLDDIVGGAFSHIVFFSQRTAEAFMYALKGFNDFDALKSTQCLCLGHSMAKVVSVLPWRTVKVAAQPNKQAMLDLLD